MDNDIQLWLLILTLIFPRLGLIIAWFGNQIPHNDIPFLGDAVLAVFFPRVLMVIYIAINLGTANAWFWAHLTMAIVAFIFNTARGMKMMHDGKNPWNPKSWMIDFK